MTSSEDSPTGGSRDCEPPTPTPEHSEPPTQRKPVTWEPWLIVIAVLCVVALVMLVGAYALWLYMWSQYDG